MNAQEWLAERFEENRNRLRAVAYRMLGSLGEAEDAVQEVWLRLSRSDAGRIENLGGWLTTVVARVCLDVLRSRKSRGEKPLGTPPQEPTGKEGAGSNPEQQAIRHRSQTTPVLFESLRQPFLSSHAVTFLLRGSAYQPNATNTR